LLTRKETVVNPAKTRLKMAFIQTIPESEAFGDVRDLYKRSSKKRVYVPDHIQAAESASRGNGGPGWLAGDRPFQDALAPVGIGDRYCRG
jgi:hypothetical protein